VAGTTVKAIQYIEAENNEGVRCYLEEKRVLTQAKKLISSVILFSFRDPFDNRSSFCLSRKSLNGGYG